jgi:phosphoribosyl 1,2-cyclic phosphodiesterase
MSGSIEPASIGLRFWGARGTLASPGPDTTQYGGNTACVALRCGPHLVILDAGSGLRPLGAALLAEGRAIDADLFCSHTHLDHVCGLPYFAPLYRTETSLHLWAGNLAPPHSLQAVVTTLMTHPLNPDLLSLVRASLRFSEFAAGATLRPRPDLTVHTAPLRHPGGSTGYRIEWAGRSVAFLTDTEHPPAGADRNVLRLAAGTDLMIYDTSYTDAEYPSHVGWGHSTWQEGVRIAAAAGAGRLVLFHHETARSDAELADIERAAAALRPGTVVAREGMELAV